MANTCAVMGAMAGRKNSEWEIKVPPAKEAAMLSVPLVPELAVHAAVQVVKDEMKFAEPMLGGVDLAGRLYNATIAVKNPTALIGIIGGNVLPVSLAQRATPEIAKTIGHPDVAAASRFMSTAYRAPAPVFEATAAGAYSSLRAGQVVNAKPWGLMNKGYFTDSFVSPDDHVRNLAHTYSLICKPDSVFKILCKDQTKAHIMNQSLINRGARAVFVGMANNPTAKIKGEMYLTDSKGMAMLDLDRAPVPSLPKKAVTLDELRVDLTDEFKKKHDSYLLHGFSSMALMGSVLINTIEEHKYGIQAARCVVPELDKGNCLYLFGDWKKFFDVTPVTPKQMFEAVNICSVLRAGWIWRRLAGARMLARLKIPFVPYVWCPHLPPIKVSTFGEFKTLVSLGMAADIDVVDVAASVAGSKAADSTSQYESNVDGVVASLTLANFS